MKINKYSQKNNVNDLMMEAVEVQRSSTHSEDDFQENPKKNSRSASSTESDASHNSRGGEDETEERKLPMKCILRTVIFLIVAAILFGILFATGVLTNDDLSRVPILGDIDFEGFFDSDPYGGMVGPENPEDAYRWNSPNQAGLELTLVNALTDDWQQEFQKAVSDWEEGSPDTLTLSTNRVAVDTECEPLSGLLKVCNGNYGETEWRGLNAILLDMQRRYIHSSTAKMNEFYLQKASRAQRQYTMCHELGHGFGLPHWDENFYNRNIGNCMDYTSRPRTNQGPDASNFEFLKQLYGEVGATQAPLSSSPPQGPTGGSGWNGPSGPPPPPRDKKEEDKEEDDRRLRGVGGVVDQDVIPEAVMEAYKAVLNGESLPQHRSRLLDSDEDGEATLIDMGVGNLGLLVYKLRSVPKGDD